VFKNDRDSFGTNPYEASHFVGGAEEGSTKVRWVVNGKDLLLRFFKRCHFFIVASKSIVPLKSVMLWSPDSFTVVSKWK
jgi:hypothetical protein